MEKQTDRQTPQSHLVAERRLRDRRASSMPAASAILRRRPRAWTLIGRGRPVETVSAALTSNADRRHAAVARFVAGGNSVLKRVDEELDCSAVVGHRRTLDGGALPEVLLHNTAQRPLDPCSTTPRKYVEKNSWGKLGLSKKFFSVRLVQV